MQGRQPFLFPEMELEEEVTVPQDVGGLSIAIDDLPPDCQLVARVIGLESALQLFRGASGCTLCIPKMWYRKPLRRYVHAHFNGTNSKEIALKFGVTQRHIYKLYSEKEEEKTTDGNQT